MNEIVSCSERKDESPSSTTIEGEKLGPSSTTDDAESAVERGVMDSADELLKSRVRPPKGEKDGSRLLTGDDMGVGAFLRTGLRLSDEANEGNRRRGALGVDTTLNVPTPLRSRVDLARRTMAPTVSSPEENASLSLLSSWADEDICEPSESSEHHSWSSSLSAPTVCFSVAPRKSRRRRAEAERMPSGGYDRRWRVRREGLGWLKTGAAGLIGRRTAVKEGEGRPDGTGVRRKSILR